MEFKAILNTVLNQPNFKTQLPTDPEDPTKVKGFTEPLTKKEEREILNNADKIDEPGDAMLKQEVEKIQRGDYNDQE